MRKRKWEGKITGSKTFLLDLFSEVMKKPANSDSYQNPIFLKVLVVLSHGASVLIFIM